MRLLILDQITTDTLLRDFAQLKVKPISLQDAKNWAYKSSCETNSHSLCELLGVIDFVYKDMPQWDADSRILLGALGSWLLISKNVTINLVNYTAANGSMVIYPHLATLEKGSTILIRSSQLTSHMFTFFQDFDFIVKRWTKKGNTYSTRLEEHNIPKGSNKGFVD